VKRRRGDSHRILRWLWTSRTLGARLGRLPLIPAAGLWKAVMWGRTTAYRRGWLPTHELPVPSIGVGNLTVGGSGKTPIAIWIARHLAARGHRPGILLRGYAGGDEARVHQHSVPEAVVVANPDRVAGAAAAVTQGADVVVLDDAYQRLDVDRSLNIAVVAAETTRAVRWPVPAGPWREGFSALDRADVLIVTRKRASAEVARELARELSSRVAGPTAIAHLSVTRLHGLVSGKPFDGAGLAGRRVVVAAAIADPDAFVAQVKGTGAQVQVATWNDHHEYRDEDLAWLAHAARRADHVVTTEKDAVKLRDRWPAAVPEPLVAVLGLAWELGGEEVVAAVDGILQGQAFGRADVRSPRV